MANVNNKTCDNWEQYEKGTKQLEHQTKERLKETPNKTKNKTKKRTKQTPKKTKQTLNKKVQQIARKQMDWPTTKTTIKLFPVLYL